MQELIAHIKKFVALTPAEADILAAYVQCRTLAKKELLLKEGQVCTATYFVVKGCARQYYINKLGGEQTVQFAIEHWWIADYMSLENRQPSLFYIQAVENTTVLFIEKAVQDELFGKLPQLERYFRLVLQKSYAASLVRIQYMFNLSGEERYRKFESNYPEFVQRVPQYMLASFLGFSAEFLSKIRAKKTGRVS